MRDTRLAVRLRQAGPIPLDVEFTCEPGAVLAIFGPSGSGKTTVLRSIAGLYRPEQATITSGSDRWIDTSAGVFVPPHRRSVGLVFQEYALFPHLTAVGNVAIALGHVPRGERRTRAEALLERVHLSGKSTRRPHELSGGERQRVALARALARDPSVLLLDEPFAAVDRRVRRLLQDEIDGLRRTLDVPLVLVTHEIDDVARLATHVLLLEHGRAVACDAITTLMSRPDLGWLRETAALGAVFEAVVTGTGRGTGLADVAYDGGTLRVPARDLKPGAPVRLRIPAREVILATQAPEGLSLHNVLSGTVAAIHRQPHEDQVTVQVLVGGVRLLADVTPDAIERLHLDIGAPVHALIKAVSIDVLGQTDGAHD